MDHHEAAAADIAGPRIGDGKRKSCRDRRIDGVAALAQDVAADLRGDLLLCHHDTVLGADGRSAVCGRWHIGVAGERACRKDQTEREGRHEKAVASFGDHQDTNGFGRKLKLIFADATWRRPEKPKRVGVISNEIFAGDACSRVIR
jgi:hypothetical protein